MIIQLFILFLAAVAMYWTMRGIERLNAPYRHVAVTIILSIVFYMM